MKNTFFITLIFFLISTAKSAEKGFPPDLADFGPAISTETLKKVVEYMASEKMEGRMTGSPQELEYSNHLAQLFKKMKLTPVVGQSFLQSFTFTSGVKLGPLNQLTLHQEKDVSFQVEEDFIPLSFSKSGLYEKIPVAFAGYGMVAPESNGQKDYDSYAGLDVDKKWVLVFRDIPENIPNERRIFLNIYSRLHHKALVAYQRGAKGLLVVNGPNSGSRQKLMKLQQLDGGQNIESSIPIISISNQVAEMIVKNTGQSLQALQTELDGGEVKPRELKRSYLTAQVDVKPILANGHNVLALLKVPGAKYTLVIGAHGDHLGRGTGNSLATATEKGQIHFGADDNASGVAGVLQLASYFSMNPNKKLKQNILFAVWSGEEIGVLGSNYFIKNQSKGMKISANLNMDMIGRLREKLSIQGVGSAKEWNSILENSLNNSSLVVSLQQDPYLPTDSMSFYMNNIPGLSFFTGAHGEYHSPRDVASLINYEGQKKVIELVAKVAEKVTEKNQSLTYLKVEGKKQPSRGMRIYLGTIPDYSQEGVKGVRITGTSKNSPAEKAGLEAGDVIVELGGTKIENMYDYVYCLQSMKANQETMIKVLRNGKLAELKLLPVLRE